MMPNVGDTATLRDSRDNQKYLVGKLADGKYWMLDNLALGGDTEIALSSANTNIAGGMTWTLPASVSSGFSSLTEAQINADYKSDRVTSYGVGSGKVGVYYNFCAASAGTICADSNSSNASYDVCPKGWRMPTGGASGEYQTLYVDYNSNVTDFGNALSMLFSGNFSGGSQAGPGVGGYFWSSTYYDAGGMHSLRIYQSGLIEPQTANGRGGGFTVRCVFNG